MMRPLINRIPSMTFPNKLMPFDSLPGFFRFHCQLENQVSVANRDPQPFVRFVRSLTVAKVDSIGLVDRM